MRRSSLPLAGACLGLAMQAMAHSSAVPAQQQPPPNIRQQHLEMCVGEMTAKVSEMEAIQAVMKNEDLPPNQKLDQLRAILSPEQKQHLRTCIRAEMMKELSGG
jgi:hypothetical protein